jgi:F-type H+-transporting ATPase subunit delta
LTGAVRLALGILEIARLSQEKTLVSGMAGRYALALFELAKDANSTNSIAAELNQFADLIRETQDLERFLKSPVFSATEQLKVINAILAHASIEGLTAKFLQLVAKKRRLFALSNIIRDFNILNDADKGITRAQVTAATNLQDEHIEALKAALAGLASGTTIEITVKVDPSIIGGLIVQIGSRMVDGSLKTKLNSIRTRMKEVG